MATNDKKQSTAQEPSATEGADQDVKGAVSNAEAANKQVDEAFAPIQEQGFVGVKVDPTPNEHYTVEGVTSGKPTPETDADAYAEANPPAGGPQAKGSDA